MSESYRRLREDLPVPPDAGGFAADVRRVKAWIAALPRANAHATEVELTRALRALLAQRLEGAQRLAALEEMRPVVLEAATLLDSQYHANPLPLPPDKAHAYWIDLRSFADDVDRALARVRDGQSELAPAAGLTVRVGNDLLIRLRRAFGQIAARGLKRLPAGHRLDTVLGVGRLEISRRFRTDDHRRLRVRGR